MFKERGIPQEGIDELGQVYDDVLLKHSGVEKRLSEIATIYEEEYTPEEISALVDFFKTSYGESILRKEAFVTERVMRIALEEANSTKPKEMLEDLKKAGERVVKKYSEVE